MNAPRKIRVIMYSKPECLLCDEAKAVLDDAGRVFPLDITVRNIAGDSELEAEFGEQIPVIFIEGRKVFKFRIDPSALERKLRGHLTPEEDTAFR